MAVAAHHWASVCALLQGHGVAIVGQAGEAEEARVAVAAAERLQKQEPQNGLVPAVRFGSQSSAVAVGAGGAHILSTRTSRADVAPALLAPCGWHGATTTGGGCHSKGAKEAKGANFFIRRESAPWPRAGGTARPPPAAVATARGPRGPRGPTFSYVEMRRPCCTGLPFVGHATANRANSEWPRSVPPPPPTAWYAPGPEFPCARDPIPAA